MERSAGDGGVIVVDGRYQCVQRVVVHEVVKQIHTLPSDQCLFVSQAAANGPHRRSPGVQQVLLCARPGRAVAELGHPAVEVSSRRRPTHRHDHATCVADALAIAAEICSERGGRLTPIRRRVLELVWGEHKPVGAYDILASLGAEDGRAAAPPTVYRALEFLMEHGLVLPSHHGMDDDDVDYVCETADAFLAEKGLP